MSRRRRRPLIPTVWMDWCDEVRDLLEPYRLLSEGMAEPRRVRLYDGHAHTTLVARFTAENGDASTLTLRFSKDRP